MRNRTIRKGTEPAFIEPMQCKPVTALPPGEKWTFEIKFDGYRCIALRARCVEFGACDCARPKGVSRFLRHPNDSNHFFKD